MQNTIRAFIAINLPPEVKAYLGQLSADLAGKVPRGAVRWVKPERMHLTLRFIGETEKNLIPDLGRVLDDTAAQHQRFSLFLQGFGCFPNCKRPRVLWAGIDGDIAASIALKEAVDEALVPFGWERDKRSLRPHLTVGRVKDSRKVAGQQWPGTVEPLAIPVKAIHLIESVLTPQGPIYTICNSSPLQHG